MTKHRSKLKSLNGNQFCRAAVLITSVVLILLFLVSVFYNNDKITNLSLGFTVQKWNPFKSVQLHPTVEFRNGTDVISQIPESVQFHPTVEFRNGTDVISQIPDSPRAVLFLAHGCNGQAVNFWDKSPSCPNCIGLPEERLLVLHALANQFAVLTISSMRRCWTFGKEMLIVKGIIRWWLLKNKLEKLPLVAMGASSGGYFVSALATSLRFSSITLMIAEGIFDQMDIAENYPPTLFVHMPKDSYRQQKIREFIEVMKNKGIDVAEVECIEFPLSPSFLADRIPGLDQTVSAKLFELFQDHGFIDRNGYLKKDGRATRWKAALHETKDLMLDKNLVQHVQEELNLAFAYHEMTSLPSEHIFKWFKSHMK